MSVASWFEWLLGHGDESYGSYMAAHATDNGSYGEAEIKLEPEVSRLNGGYPVSLSLRQQWADCERFNRQLQAYKRAPSPTHEEVYGRRAQGAGSITGAPYQIPYINGVGGKEHRSAISDYETKRRTTGWSY